MQQKLEVGDHVKYYDINLTDIGIIVALGRQQKGGDCLVVWNRYPFIKAEECLFNLRLVRKEGENA